jgi:hypothetical protein
MRKPRSDSKLDHLPDEQALQIVKWLMGGMSYEKCLLLLEKAPFYIETSTRALSEFYQHYCSLALLERRQRAAKLAMGVRKEMESNPADFDAATIELLSRWSFELASARDLNVKDVKSIMTLLLKRQDQDLKGKQVDVSVRKLELMEKREEKIKTVNNDAKLSPEEKKARINQIFGKAA